MNEEVQHNRDDETATVPAVGCRRGVGFVLRAGEFYSVFLLGLLCYTAVRRNLALVVCALLAAVAFYIAHRLLYRGWPRKRWGWLWHFLAILGILFLVALARTGQYIEPARSIKAEADLRLIVSLSKWYREWNGEYPSQLEDLADFVPEGFCPVTDPWGNTYRHSKLDDGRRVIYSFGLDRDDDGAEKKFDLASLRYSRWCFPFNLMPGFIYNLTYESKLADIDGDIRLFLPDDSRGRYERIVGRMGSRDAENAVK
jgi:hypothetical protein